MKTVRRGKHIFPVEMAHEASTALDHYPDLEDVCIHFQYSHISVQSFMLAQPEFHSLILPRKKRKYRILIKKSLVVDNRDFSERYPRHEVLVGWLGHELGHIVDYKDRSSVNLIWFGIRYHFWESFLKKAEITADRNTVKAGLIRELIISKRFGREPSVFSESYIEKLNKLYPSVQMVEEWGREHFGAVRENRSD